MAARADRDRADLVGLRGLAVVVFLAYVCGLGSGGFLAVDVLFVITGYQAAHFIVRAARAGRLSQLSFSLALVTYTPLVLVVSLGGLIALLVSWPADSGQTVAVALSSLAMLANVVTGSQVAQGSYPPFAAGELAGGPPLAHLWAVSVLQQQLAGLLVAALVVAALRRRGRGRHLLRATLLVGALSVVAAAAMAMAPGPVPGEWAGYSSLARLWEFAAAALLVLARRRVTVAPTAGPLARRWVAQALAIGGLVLVLAAWVLAGEPGRGLSPWTLVAVAGTLCLILAGAEPGASARAEPWPVRWLSLRPLTMLGAAALSVYLVSLPLVVLVAGTWGQQWLPAGAVLVVLLGLALDRAATGFTGWASGAGRTGWRRVVLPALALPLAGALIVATQVAAEALMLSSEAKTAPPGSLARTRQCLLDEFDEAALTRCRFRAKGQAKGWVLLTGGLPADALSDGVVAAANGLSLDVVAVSMPGCRPVVTAVNSSSGNVRCAQFNDRLRKLMAAKDGPDLVVIASKDPVVTPARDAWMRPAVSAVNQLSRDGVPVLWVLDVPRLSTARRDQWTPACSGGLLNRVCGITLAQAQQQQGGVRAQVRTALAKVRGVTIMDTWPRLCDGAACRAFVNDEPAYRDGSTLSRNGSRSLAPHLRSAIALALSGADHATFP